MAKIRIYRFGESVLNSNGKWQMRYGKVYTDPEACAQGAVKYIAAHPRTRFMMWDDEIDEEKLPEVEAAALNEIKNGWA